MKKIYIEPSVKAVTIKPTQVICASVDVEETSTAGEGGWSGPQSLDADFDEFEVEE